MAVLAVGSWYGMVTQLRLNDPKEDKNPQTGDNREVGNIFLYQFLNLHRIRSVLGIQRIKIVNCAKTWIKSKAGHPGLSSRFLDG